LYICFFYSKSKPTCDSVSQMVTYLFVIIDATAQRGLEVKFR